MDTALLFIQLFTTFFIIGIFTFGGGYAMLSLIQTEVVVTHHWITQSTFTDIVAISQMTPGPIGINSATYVGYEVIANSGASHAIAILGSFTATIALMIPSFVIILIIVKFYEKFKGNRFYESVMSFLRPAVIGLIGAAAIILIFQVNWSGLPLFSSCDISIIKENFIDWKSWVLLAAAMVASLKFKLNPILVIILGGIFGLILY